MFDRHYIDWNFKRIKAIIDHFGHTAFTDKTVLDLGCGHSDIGGALSRLGARVIAVDARAEHLAVAKRKYPHITTLCVDLDQKWPFESQKFDYVLNLGLICHLTNYRQLLEYCCYAAKNLILESEICDSNEVGRVVQTDESRSVYDWAFNGVGHKPSAPHVEQILKSAGMEFTRLDLPTLNTGPFKYDWTVENTQSRRLSNRRLWIAKQTNAMLTEMPPAPKEKRLVLADTNSLVLTNRPEIVFRTRSPNLKREGFKTAVCISGYLREFETTYDRLYQNLLKFTDADIYIHTWDFLGAPLRGFDNKLSKIKTYTVLNKINRLYNPVKIVVEPNIQFPTTPLMHVRNYEKRDINGMLSMFYKIEQCNQLKCLVEIERKVKYDCVVRVRPDLMILSSLNIKSSSDMSKIYIPQGYDYNGMNDQLAYGSSELMDKYSSVYSHIHGLLNQGESLNPEKLLKRHLENNNVLVERCLINYFIKRAQ
jgi:SAM-dependent methyltransferase